MDTESFDACGICFDQYDDTLRPRSLPCGHCYCTSCLEKFISYGTLVCPYCKRYHCVLSANVLPVNYALEMAISNFRRLQVGPGNTDNQPSPSERGISKWQSVLTQQKKTLIERNHIGMMGKLDLRKYEKYLSEKKATHKALLKDILNLAKRHKAIIEQLDGEENRVSELIREGNEYNNEAAKRLSECESTTCIKDIVAAGEGIEKCCDGFDDWGKRCQLLPDSSVLLSSKKLTGDTVEALSKIIAEEAEDEEDSSCTSHHFDPTLPLMNKIAEITGESNSTDDNFIKLHMGDRVVRGKDWKWGDQDGPSPSIGTVSNPPAVDGWIDVTWDTGTTSCYRNGAQGKYDIQLAD